MDGKEVQIQKRVEGRRGCGFRKPGGLYLVSGALGRACLRLPIPLDRCPTCDCGLKFTRGWTWINPAPFLAAHPCVGTRECATCPLSGAPPARVGLVWVGRMYYSPSKWSLEAQQMGVSKRIAGVPRGFVLGETWVWVAHLDAVKQLGGDGEWHSSPGVFHVFRPSAIEYVVKGTEEPEELEALAARGITLVEVTPSKQMEGFPDGN
ncbi:MAG: hypothetical protein RBU21_05935 [FCB group bacterium]|jgi:hypothetical protein|nr:hypothetical protein [FCB group bacterium]